MGWHVARDPWYGCELWQGPLNSNGYPTHWSRDGPPRQAYLVAWERERGPIPPERELDHLCRRRTCVAVAHFELVTRDENQRRKFWPHRSQLHTGNCSKGHAYRIHGRRTPEAGMICRICSGVWTPTEEPELE